GHAHASLADVVPALRPHLAIRRRERIPLARWDDQPFVPAGQDLDLALVLPRDVDHLPPLVLQADPLHMETERLAAELRLKHLFGQGLGADRLPPGQTGLVAV